jgi:hypothetical protein
VLVDPGILRMLLFGLALILVMLYRPAGLWPSPRRRASSSPRAAEVMSETLLEARGIGKRFGGVQRCKTSRSPSAAARSTA